MSLPPREAYSIPTGDGPLTGAIRQPHPDPARRFGNFPVRRLYLRGLIIIGFLLGGAGLLDYCNVDKNLTAEDRHYIRLFLPNVPEGIASSLTYPQQVALIERAQRAVHRRITGWKGIAEGLPREPKQLYLGRHGLCYDRSRVLEKIYTYLGFPNRHVALFAREGQTAGWITVLFHHVPSHAVSEVRTKKGWLMVDSNTLWVSLDATNRPVSLPQFQERNDEVSWSEPIIQPNRQVYSQPFILVYGLYSRHGLFYGPFIPGIPDCQLQDLRYNLAPLLADLLTDLRADYAALTSPGPARASPRLPAPALARAGRPPLLTR